MSYGFCSKFHTLSSTAKILKIRYDLTKLQRVKRWELFLRYSVVRLPDMYVGGLIFYPDSFFLSFFSFYPLISELAERNSTISGHMVRSKCNLKMHVQNLGYPFPLQIWGPKTTLLRILQLKGKSNGLYLRN